VNLLTAQTILTLIERGKADYEAGSYDPIAIIEEYNFPWCDAAYAAGKDIAAGRWIVDFNLTEKTWERIGCPPYDYNWDTYCRSWNHRDSDWEFGLSVMDDDWKQRINYAWWKDSIPERATLRNALFFSTMIFLSQGPIDFLPMGRHRYYVMLEMILGWLLLALFLVTLGKVMIR